MPGARASPYPAQAAVAAPVADAAVPTSNGVAHHIPAAVVPAGVQQPAPAAPAPTTEPAAAAPEAAAPAAEVAVASGPAEEEAKPEAAAAEAADDVLMPAPGEQQDFRLPSMTGAWAVLRLLPFFIPPLFPSLLVAKGRRRCSPVSCLAPPKGHRQLAITSRPQPVSQIHRPQLSPYWDSSASWKAHSTRRRGGWYLRSAPTRPLPWSRRQRAKRSTHHRPRRRRPGGDVRVWQQSSSSRGRGGELRPSSGRVKGGQRRLPANHPMRRRRRSSSRGRRRRQRWPRPPLHPSCPAHQGQRRRTLVLLQERQTAAPPALRRRQPPVLQRKQRRMGGRRDLGEERQLFAPAHPQPSLLGS